LLGITDYPINTDILKQIRELASAITWCAATDATDKKNTDNIVIVINEPTKSKENRVKKIIGLKDFIKLISIPNGLEPYVYLLEQTIHELIGKYAAHIMGKHIIVVTGDDKNYTVDENYGDQKLDKIYLKYTRHADEGEYYDVLEPPQITCNRKMLPSNPFIEDFIQRGGKGPFNVKLSTDTQSQNVNVSTNWRFYQDLLPAAVQSDLRLCRQLASAITWRTLNTNAYKPGLNKNISASVNGTPMTISGTQFVKLMSVGFSEPCVRIDKNTLPLIGEAAADIIGRQIQVTDEETGHTTITYGSKYGDKDVLKLGISDTPFASDEKSLSAAPPSAAESQSAKASSSAKASTSALSESDLDSLKTMGINEDQIAKAVSNGKNTLDGVLDYIRDNPPEARNLPVTDLSFEYNIDDLKSPDEFVKKYVKAYGLTFDSNDSYQPDTRRSLVMVNPCPVANWTVIQTIGDGNCLTHAFLQCMSPKYRKIHMDTQVTNVEKTAVARAFRLAFANINPLLLHANARIDLNNKGGMADLGEETFASYARLFGVILVVFNVRNSTIMVANLTKETAIRGMPVIFMHGDGGHFSSLLPTVASVPAKPFVIKYADAIQIECLKVPLTFPNESAFISNDGEVISIKMAQIPDA
jgi:hypothetical protein